MFFVSEQHFLNELAVWMNRLNLNDSLINSDSLPPTGGFYFTFKVSWNHKTLFLTCKQICIGCTSLKTLKVLINVIHKWKIVIFAFFRAISVFRFEKLSQSNVTKSDIIVYFRPNYGHGRTCWRRPFRVIIDIYSWHKAHLIQSLRCSMHKIIIAVLCMRKYHFSRLGLLSFRYISLVFVSSVLQHNVFSWDVTRAEVCVHVDCFAVIY